MTTDKPGARRARIERFAGLASLAVMGAALLAGCSQKGHDASQVVAQVGDAEVTELQVSQLLERQPALKADQVDAYSRKMVSGLVDQEIVLQKAGEIKLEREPRVMQNIESMKRELVVRAYLERIADGATKPTEKDVQAYYDANPELFASRRIYTFHEVSMKVSEAQKKEIEAQLSALKSPAELDSYLKTKGVSANARQSTVAAENVPGTMLKRLATLNPGQGLIVAANDGLHVLLLLGTQDSPVGIDQARPVITGFLLKQRQQHAVEQELASLRGAAKVRYFGKYADMAASAPAPSAASSAPWPLTPASATAGNPDTSKPT
jgi:EpsD family peptidyl-prolyl cis-trans isomerase